MKKAGILMMFILVVALLVSCAQKGMEELTGSWQRLNGSDTITFSTDGKAQLVSSLANVSASYSIVKKGNLQLDLGILGNPTLKYSLTKDELSLTDPKGKEIKYLRVIKEETKVPAARQD